MPDAGASGRWLRRGHLAASLPEARPMRQMCVRGGAHEAHSLSRRQRAQSKRPMRKFSRSRLALTLRIALSVVRSEADDRFAIPQFTSRQARTLLHASRECVSARKIRAFAILPAFLGTDRGGHDGGRARDRSRAFANVTIEPRRADYDGARHRAGNHRHLYG